MEETAQYLEIEENKWYNKQWLVVLVLVFFWPLGIYAFFKSDFKKGILLKFFGLVLIVLVGFIMQPDKKNFNSIHDKVKNSQWDGSVDVAERYLKRNLLKDPSSYESISWGKVAKNPDGSYQVTHTFRARNGFGGMGKETITFIISSDGSRVINYY